MMYLSPPAKSFFLSLFLLGVATSNAFSRDFSVRTISEPGKDARNPSIGGSGLVAWQGFSDHLFEAPTSTRPDVLRPPAGSKRSDIFLWNDGAIRNVTVGESRIPSRSERPLVQGNSVFFTSWFRDDDRSGFSFDLVVPPKSAEMVRMETDYPDLFDPPIDAPKSALEALAAAEEEQTEVPEEPPPESSPALTGRTQEGNLQYQMWRGSGKAGDIAMFGENNQILRITPGTRHFGSPAASDAGVAFQVARGWPYGYEILIWKPGDAALTQLTTNYFYVLNPDVHDQELVYQAWDGNDFEIFRHRFDNGQTEQVTNNQFDDVSPVVWNGEIAWIAHPTVNPEVFHVREGLIRKISEGSEDNSSPSIWNGRVIWQGYDDTDLEIYYFDGRRTIKLTSNAWDDLAPRIRDGLIVWMSYVGNGGAEIMAIDLDDNIAVQLTENDWEDSFPKTAGERIVWQTLTPEGSSVSLAEPKSPRASPVE